MFVGFGPFWAELEGGDGRGWFWEWKLPPPPFLGSVSNGVLRNRASAPPVAGNGPRSMSLPSAHAVAAVYLALPLPLLSQVPGRHPLVLRGATDPASDFLRFGPGEGRVSGRADVPDLGETYLDRSGEGFPMFLAEF